MIHYTALSAEDPAGIREMSQMATAIVREDDRNLGFLAFYPKSDALYLSKFYLYKAGVQHLLHLKSKSKILRPIEIMGFFYEFFCQIQENSLL